MKKQIFTLALIFSAAFGYSQIVLPPIESNNSNPWPISGKVGIGTTTPAYKLQVLKNTTFLNVAGSYSETIASIGNLANSSLHFETLGSTGGRLSTEVFHTLKLQMHDQSAKVGFIDFNTQATANTTKAAMSFGTNGVEAMRINQTGKVRIGSGANDIKTPDGYRLFVEEGILTEKVKVAVKTTANWADYVFANDYKLMPLEEVEQFTKENKHLPNVPSAKEMVTDGLDVAAMDAKLLEKIEELTLYLIEQKKESGELKAQLASQKQELDTLKAEMKLVNEKK